MAAKESEVGTIPPGPCTCHVPTFVERMPAKPAKAKNSICCLGKSKLPSNWRPAQNYREFWLATNLLAEPIWLAPIWPHVCACGQKLGLLALLALWTSCIVHFLLACFLHMLRNHHFVMLLRCWRQQARSGKVAIQKSLRSCWIAHPVILLPVSFLGAASWARRAKRKPSRRTSWAES